MCGVNRTILLFLCLLLGFWSHNANANDASSSGIGGRWHMLKGEHKQVQMVREYVRIVPWKSWRYEFQTTADFVFRNYGPATTVEMGFPESQGGVDAEGPEAFAYFRTQSTFSRFRSWVDGRPVAVQRRVIGGADESCKALWVKTVRFKRNQTRHVRVQYVSECGGGASDGELWVEYQFTGGNWRGEVEQSVLDVKLPGGAYILPIRSDEIPPSSQRRQRGNHFRFRWTHWQAQEDFDLSFFPVFPNDLLLKLPSASVARNARPFYHASRLSSHPLLPVVRGNGRADCILLHGRLWVAANAFSPRWDENRHGVILRSGNKRAFISARGATRRSSLWPLAPNGTFWVSEFGDNGVLMVPARQIMRGLGGRFGFDFSRGHAIWVHGKTRKVLRANPYV
ncbi:hypothetical protein IAD21_03635 [Abditibacteriota bacterium]|nr:hypothetical protein IAD21_03635 [Abditibacteriota bacterium]